MTGRTIHTQAMRKLIIQPAFRITHARSWRVIVTMARIAPQNLHPQVTTRTMIATIQKDNRNQSSNWTGPQMDGSVMKMLRSTNRNYKTLQMRAVHRMIFMKRELTCKLPIGVLPLAHIPVKITDYRTRRRTPSPFACRASSLAIRRCMRSRSNISFYIFL